MAIARSGVDGSRCIYACGMAVCRGLGPRPAVSAILLNFYPLSFYPTTDPVSTGQGHAMRHDHRSPERVKELGRRQVVDSAMADVTVMGTYSHLTCRTVNDRYL